MRTCTNLCKSGASFIRNYQTTTAEFLFWAKWLPSAPAKKNRVLLISYAFKRQILKVLQCTDLEKYKANNSTAQK